MMDREVIDMTFELPELPYAEAALEPHISRETLALHHGKHHAQYIANLNELAEDDASLASKSLLDIVRGANGSVFNNAAQAWNHNFYWSSMKPLGGGEPTGRVAELIRRDFGSFGDFKERFSKTATGHFGSGWAWLVLDAGGKLAVIDTHDAGCPLTMGKKPVLTCDVWEHAYYVDHRNERAKYVEAWWNLVSWDFANANIR
jgi:superoxide dismutase, Fe-Mn family